MSDPTPPPGGWPPAMSESSSEGRGDGAAAAAADPPTQLGDFRIVRLIAVGGMGAIYEAIQEPLGRRVAVKTIRNRRQHLQGAHHARFSREQKVLAQLHHTHIVPILAAGREGSLQYFAMSYIEGAALHDVVRMAQAHGSSAHRRAGAGAGPPPTPTLAEFAAEAHSERLPSAAPPTTQPSSSSTAPRDAPPPAAVSPGAAAKNQEGEAGDSEGGDHRSSRGGGKRVLSARYFRSVARVMIDAAEAMRHAHEAGIIHRDLKPSNLMVDRSEHCWVLDFGLAGYLRAQSDGPGPARGEASDEPAEDGPAAPSAAALDLGPDPAPPPVSGVMGTPDYMAPEQLESRADARADVWGLGVTLYELLTLSRPFAGPAAISSLEPARPRSLVAGLPRDLEAICLKAIQKAPRDRYQSPGDLASDLRRWLASEPIAARKARAVRRLALWARRNKGWAAAGSIAALAVLVLGAGGLILGKTAAAAEKTAAAAARAELAFANQRAEAAERDARRKEHQLFLQSIQRLRAAPHHAGWTRNVRAQIREAVARGEGTIDRELQSLATGNLFGLDARTVKEFQDLGAVSLAVDPRGERVLLGGVTEPTLGGKALKARLITGGFERSQELAVTEYGPVAFRPDGTPVQLIPREGEQGAADQLELVDLGSGALLRRFELPRGKLAMSFLRQVGLAGDGTLAAAPVVERDGRTSLLVWDAATGQRRAAFAWEPSALAFSPDGSLLAAGAADGRIRVWSLANGELVAELGATRTEIMCLAFGRNPHWNPGRASRPKQPNWLLAAGDSGAVATIYDLSRRQAQTICRGTSFGIFAVAFSPDGSLLASSGRGPVRLWDAASGTELVQVPCGDYSHGLAFMPDGRRLAVCSTPVHGSGLVALVELEPGRGIGTLRGLAGRIGKIRFSRDGRRVAAITHDWQVAAWDRATGRLLHTMDAPPGRFIDNVALAFSPDGKLLAFAGGHEARLWDLDAEVERTWSFRQGQANHEALQDCLALLEDGRLLSVRVETKDGIEPPFTHANPRKHPRVLRLRNLLGERPLEPILEITEHDLGMNWVSITDDGKFLLVQGLAGPPGKVRLTLNGYEAGTGKRIWSDDLRGDPNQVPHRMDPSAALETFTLPGDQRRTVIDVATGKRLESMETNLFTLGPKATAGIRDTAGTLEDPAGIVFWRRNGDQDPVQPLFRLHNDANFTPTGEFWAYTHDGRFAAGGNAQDVLVFEFAAIQRQLGEIGMGW